MIKKIYDILFTMKFSKITGSFCIILFSVSFSSLSAETIANILLKISSDEYIENFKKSTPKILKIICKKSKYYAYSEFTNIPNSGMNIFWGIWNHNLKNYSEKNYRKLYPWSVNHLSTWNGDFSPNHIKDGNYIFVKIISPITTTKIKKCF